MDDGPLVSVVIPTYNRPECLDRALRSVIEQTYNNLDIIVVDDASHQDVNPIVDRHNGVPIRLVTHDRNRGGGVARNTGITHAEGEYIAFLDDDDEWVSNKLERQIQYLSSKSDEWIAVYCDVEFVRNSALKKVFDRLVPRFEGMEGGSELIPAVLKRSYGIPGTASTLVVRREAAIKLEGFDETFQRYQDWEFTVRLLLEGKLACVDAKLVRKHDTGYPSVDKITQGEEMFSSALSNIIDRYDDDVDFKGVQEFTIAKAYYREGKIRAGTSHVVAARTYSTRQRLSLLWSILAGMRKAL